jgi:hypothetical protein
MSENSTCLVLYIEEIENYGNTLLDTKLFISYDFEDDSYVLYGKREDTSVSNFTPYFLRCISSSDLYDFIRCIICKQNKINITLYNYNNMPIDCESVDYYFMENNKDSRYEIVGYDNSDFDKTLKQMIRCVRNMYNNY